MSFKEKKVNGYSELSETVTLVDTDSKLTSAFQMKPFRAGDSEYIAITALLSAGASGNVIATLHAAQTESGTYTSVGATLFTIGAGVTVGYAKVDLRQYPAPWYKLNFQCAADESAVTCTAKIYHI